MKFNSILVNDRQTSLTTEMGPDWKLWEAIREIFCNAVDEGNGRVAIRNDLVPQKGYTKFYCESNDALKEIIDNWGKYFSSERTDIIMKNKEWEVFNPIDSCVTIYRKGIRCYDTLKASIYDYSISNIDINESRTLKYGWQLKEKLARLWGLYATKDMIRNLFTSTIIKEKDLIENGISWRGYVESFNDNWLAVIGNRILIPRSVSGYFQKEQAHGIVLDGSLCNALKKHLKDKVKVVGLHDEYGNFTEIPPTKKHTYLLSEVTKFFEKAELKVDYSIVIAIFEDKETLGKVDNKRIILSDRVFELGKKMIASTILEECFHLESQSADKTRDFQDFIINKILTILENNSGIFL